jgi:hypothetical protein
MAGTSSLEPLLRRRWVAGLLVFLAALAVYAPTVSEGVSTDVAATSLTSWQIAHTGQPWMEDLDLSAETPIPYFGPGADGHTVTARTPGPIWAGVPFYVGSSSDQSDLSYRRSGLAASVLSAAAVVMMFLALRTRMSLVGAAGVAAVFALGTPVWSVSADALWTHSVTVFGLAGAALAASRERWLHTGLWFAIGILGRPHVALIAALMGLGMAWSRRSPAVALRVGAISTLGLAVLVGWNRYVFGTWSVQSGYGKSAEAVVSGADTGVGFLENLAGFLVSPDRGFLVWTPLALLLLPAVVRSRRDTPDWSRWLAAGGVAYTLLQLQLNVFTGGDAFYAYRLGLEMLVCLTPLYAFSLAAGGRIARHTAPVLLGVQVAAISFGAVVGGVFIHQDQVWTDNSLFVALRHEPLIVGLYLAVLSLGGALVAHRLVSRVNASGRVAIFSLDPGDEPSRTTT